MRLYDNLSSANAYKVRLLLALLGTGYERVEMDIDQGETRSAEFLRKNPNGRIPLLELDDGRVLAESGAILFYLAQGTQLLGADAWAQAQTLQWMFFEQYSHEPYIAVSRYIRTHLPADHARRAELPGLALRGYAALDVMQQHLARRPYFVDDAFSIADIALYAYTHVAGEGGFDLQPYAQIRAWLSRCTDRVGFVAIDAG
jgi:glutathione S-transferase